jgi:hypothetical protein
VPPTIGDVTVTGVTDVLLASANTATFVVTSAMTQGETYSASWAFGDGTSASAAISNGTASTTKSFATAGTFVPRVTVTGSRGGSTTRDYRTITVATLTGRWVGQWRLTSSTGTFTINLTQNGSQITGDSVDSFAGDGRSNVTGSVSGPPSRVRLRLAYADNSFYDMDVTGSADQRTFSGTLAGVNSFPFSMTKQ